MARPVRSSDGRWVVGGWSAQRFVSGAANPGQAVIETSLLLHQALADVLTPRSAGPGRPGPTGWPGVKRWTGVGCGRGRGARLVDELAVGRKPVDLPPQVVHGDMFGNVLFAGTAPPAVVDITPYWHPASWSAAVIAVDALSWGGAQTDLLQRWAHLPEWPQMLLRALIFRLAVSLARPRRLASLPLSRCCRPRRSSVRSWIEPTRGRQSRQVARWQAGRHDTQHEMGEPMVRLSGQAPVDGDLGQRARRRVGMRPPPVPNTPPLRLRREWPTRRRRSASESTPLPSPGPSARSSRRGRGRRRAAVR